MQVWFVEDIAYDDEVTTHVTDNHYSSSASVEPYPCMMPRCHEQFDQGVIVLEFYLNMEEASHATYLFDNSSHTCTFGCRKGFINAHSLPRHYLSTEC
jgi:hypothetical protein